MNLENKNLTGLKMLKEKKYDDCVNYYKKAISELSFFAPFYGNCAIAYLNLNKISEAIDYANKGIEISLYEFSYFKILASIYEKINDLEKRDTVWKLAQEKNTIINWLQRPSHLVRSILSKPWYDLNEFKYQTDLLINNFKIIKKELNYLIENKISFQRDTEKLTEKNKGWNKYVLYHKGIKNINECRNCPETTKIIEKIQDATTLVCGQIEFSKLEPNTHIKEHCAYTNIRTRIHLGLIVPDNVEIMVGNIKKSWVEGSCIILDDSYNHEVWHNGNEDRYILIVDIWHKDLNTFEKRFNSLENNEDKIKYYSICKDNNLI